MTKTLAQQSSIGKASFLNVKISRNRTYTQTHSHIYNHIHTHTLTQIRSQTHTNIRTHIWVVLQKLPQLSDMHFSQVLNKLEKIFFMVL